MTACDSQIIAANLSAPYGLIATLPELVTLRSQFAWPIFAFHAVTLQSFFKAPASCFARLALVEAPHR
jgi:hypothetical protein